MTTIELKFLNADYLKDITETITNIPLNIGVGHLKVVTYLTILPLFLKRSHNYPLTLEDVMLRSKNWVEMLPKGSGDEDVNAIEAEFFTLKGKAKMRQFLPTKVLDLYLGISFPLRNEIEDHIEQSELNTVSKKKISTITSKYNHRDDEDATPSVPQTKLFSESAMIQDDEDSVVVLEAKPERKRLEKKRQRQISVSSNSNICISPF